VANLFIALPSADRREALAVASAETGRPIHLLEKDVWVVWTLDALFIAPFGEHLVFKGGTSLSKAYGIIQRFSEDIDVTYDIRSIAPEIAGTGPEPLPPTASQARKWRDVVEAKLPIWAAEVVLPYVKERLAADGLDATLHAEGECLHISYEPLEKGTGYVAPSVRVEFGAKSTGEPARPVEITCDAAAFLTQLEFPTAKPRVMTAERTFWEKATAAHAYCLNGVIRGRGAYARHWHDLTKLAEAGIAETASNDRELAEAVARHKTLFFAEKGDEGPVDYHVAVGGAIKLVPEGDRYTRLEADYAAMTVDGLLPDPVEPFKDVVAKCEGIQQLLNRQIDK
jgi:hypothetical protein